MGTRDLLFAEEEVVLDFLVVHVEILGNTVDDEHLAVPFEVLQRKRHEGPSVETLELLGNRLRNGLVSERNSGDLDVVAVPGFSDGSEVERTQFVEYCLEVGLLYSQNLEEKQLEDHGHFQVESVRVGRHLMGQLELGLFHREHVVQGTVVEDFKRVLASFR